MTNESLNVVLNASLETVAEKMGVTVESLRAELLAQGPESAGVSNVAKIVLIAHDLIAQS